MLIYFNGKIIEEEKCYISPYDRGFLFADGVYEVIRYTGKKFFEFDYHYNRLLKGLDFLKIKFSGVNKLFEISSNLIRLNNLKNRNSLIYIQITRGASKPRYHFFPDENTVPTVFINASPLSENKVLKKGVKVILEKDIRWSRCDIKTISLLPNVLARQKAKEKNVAETVLVRNGRITEGTHTNFCGIKEGCLYTAPLSNYILPGITRKFVLKLCKDLSIPVKEKYIYEKDIINFDEFMLVSTTMDVTPVIRINDFLINYGKPGQITKKIQKEYLKFLNS